TGCRWRTPPAGRWRCAACLRAILSCRSHGFRRSQRSREQSFTPGAKRARHAPARRTGNEAESVLFAEGEMTMATATELAMYARIREDLFRPLSGVSRGYLLATAAAFVVAASGLAAWSYQLRLGMGVTGLQRPVFWGFYIVNFVFWIGISHAGTLISAIL